MLVPMRLGLAITTIGRPGLEALLQSAATSTQLPDAVAIANQTGGPLTIDTHVYPFPVTVVKSSGGASVGRNDATTALPANVDLISFPNDTSIYPAETLKSAMQCFGHLAEPDAITGTLIEGGLLQRHPLPPDGELLNRASVWWAIEPTVFMRRSSFVEVGGFRKDIGTGADSPWQSGEGTELLLRLMTRGGTIVSKPDIVVLGPGERRHLSADAWVAKNRRYARGTGYVYRVHAYPKRVKIRTLAGPLLLPTRHDPVLKTSLRLAVARSVGRLEGLLAHPFTPGGKTHEMRMTT